MLPVRYEHLHIKSKAILLTCGGGPEGCEMLRILHCLDSSQMTVKSASGTGLALLPQKLFFFVSGTHFC
jgi:hypothetical protein